MGIAKDWKVEAGIEHLAKVGAFDEIISGRSWWNHGLSKYVWNDLTGEAATPSILVIGRVYSSTAQGDGRETSYRVEKERLLSRKVGLKEIYKWNELGAPIPRL